ncbi:MAG: DNA gyrase subunit A, partial [Parcubacteria group bacterium]|nr:DNA gyrase subunit A [Parcubacteria group bacterium]
PDFPTGGLIFNPKNIQEVYAHGKGPIVMRAKTEIIENDSGIAQIVITEIPYQVNKARLLERIAELVKEKKFDEIKDARDESDRDGMRIVLDIKKNAMPQQVLNRLFDLTDLQTTFHVNLVALRDGIEPHTFNLKTVLSEFIAYRRIVIRKRAIFDLERTRERIHILEGLKTALDYIDEIIKLIKKSRDKEEAKVNLMKKYRLTDIQANAILEMRLHQLANLERIKIEDELKEKKLLEKELEEIVKNTKKISEIVKKETKDIIEKYGDERRTRIVSGDAEVFAREDLIPDVPSLIVITADGYLKRVSPDAFKRQERGGKGVIGVAVKEEDAVRHIAYATTHTNLLFFTSSGKVFQLKAYEIPESSRTAKGQFLANFLNVGTDEKILALLTLNKNDMKYLVLATAHGVIKKSAIEDFTNVRKSGIIAIKLKNGDALIGVELTRGDQELFCATSNGQAIRFKEKQLRAMGRAATGVRGIRLKKADAVISLGVVDPKNKNEEVLTITENGCGKRTPIKEYRIQGRGGSGIKTARVTEKTGKIINSFIIGENKEIDLLIMSLLGQIIRISLESISVLGRSTQGVRIMRFKEEKDKVASVALLR